MVALLIKNTLKIIYLSISMKNNWKFWYISNGLLLNNQKERTIDARNMDELYKYTQLKNLDPK